MLSLPTLAHPLSKTNKRPASKQTRRDTVLPSSTMTTECTLLPWTTSRAERWQPMLLGGYQQTIADKCCQMSSIRPLPTVVAAGETDGSRGRGEPDQSLPES